MFENNENTVPIQPGPAGQYPPKMAPLPQARVPKRGSGCGLSFLTFLLAMILGAGLFFAGWQYRTTMGSSLGGMSAIIPPLNGNNTESVRESVIAKVRPAVVQINVNTQNGNALGSGVITDPKGYIVTNNHVIEGAQRIEVVLFNGVTLPAKLVGTAPADDLAVLQIDPGKTALNVASIGDSSKLQVGQEVLAIGNPLGITQTVTSGIISALGRNVATGLNNAILPSTIQTDAAINPGNSGGALVDMQGNLIGIPTLTALDPEFKTPANGVGFAIPSNRVNFIVPQLIADGKVTRTGRAALDIQAADVDAVMAQQNKLPVQQGVLIVSTTANGVADKAGLKAGDVIVQVDDKAAMNVLSLGDILITKNPGDTVAVKLYRGHQILVVKVTLGELPAK